MQGTPGFLRGVAIPWSQVEEAAHHPSFLSISITQKQPPTHKEHAEEEEEEEEEERGGSGRTCLVGSSLKKEGFER